MQHIHTAHTQAHTHTHGHTHAHAHGHTRTHKKKHIHSGSVDGALSVRRLCIRVRVSESDTFGVCAVLVSVSVVFMRVLPAAVSSGAPTAM